MPDLLERLRSALADRYAVESEIGRGGMAVVFLAEDLKHHRRVAIKVLLPELTATLGAERFLHEIDIIAGLQHPQILPLYDSGEAEGILYYVMPHLEGDSLRNRLDREKQLPLDEIVQIAGEVAEALSYAHDHGVIHRDIKPENILFQAGRALLADFGIALAITAAAGTRLTETGLSLGTLQYVSPEQASGDRELDARTDIYSLAAVVYEALAGEPPHSGGTSQSIIAKVISERPDPVSDVRPSIPRNVSDAVQRGLAKTPADRFSSATQFSDALRDPAFVWSPLGVASDDRDRERHPRSRWRGITAVGSALAAGVVGLVLGFELAPPADGPRVYDVVLPDSAPMFFTGGSPWGEGWPAFTIAPNGEFVVYVARRGSSTELWYRSLLDAENFTIPGTKGAYQPMLSPDGSEVAFFVGDRLNRTSVTGDGATTITRVDRPWGGQWTSAGHIWVADRNRTLLRKIDPAAATPLTAESPVACVLPSEIPERLSLYVHGDTY